MATNKQKAIFAAGCFWGVEHLFKKEEGVISTNVGYTGGHTKKPSYKEVCNGDTGHIESVEVTYDPTETSYEDLVKFFFEIHDFTQEDGQGPDKGEQYISVIFYFNDDQKHIAERIKAELESKGYDIATKIQKTTQFWDAEDYHQDYYEKTGSSPYCHLRRKIF